MYTPAPEGPRSPVRLPGVAAVGPARPETFLSTSFLALPTAAWKKQQQFVQTIEHEHELQFCIHNTRTKSYVVIMLCASCK